MLNAGQVDAVRTSFGFDGPFTIVDEEALEAIMDRGTAVPARQGRTRAPGRMDGCLRSGDVGSALLAGATGVVSMAFLACGIALVRDTTGHD